MQRKSSELPIQIYHRIYRFARRNINAERIAVTLDLPLKTVNRILDRFARAKGEAGIAGMEFGEIGEGDAANDSFLDIYIVPKVRYVVADVSGWAIAAHKEKLEEEFDKISRSQWRVIALLMRDVLAIDEVIADVVISFREKLIKRGRYTAILDPSRPMEDFIQEHGLDDKIPIFGTEKAFEDVAFIHHGQAKGARPIHP